ncbi:unnamed protein product [Cyclocybe aegerita]|uniref:Uncharacterized protein n=1 Tax=Cyclocybe aegerita TaxID=1973307 RepID=A0A8S0WFE3_CYCAE|nr:unnamed protein product [Cyclocybe aegerita]
MDTLRKYFGKGKNSKKGDKTLRHSRSMPLRGSAGTSPELYAHHQKPSFQSKHGKELRVSQVGFPVIDIGRGPNAGFLHPAFQDASDDEDAALNFERPREVPPLSAKEMHDLLGRFPSPPSIWDQPSKMSLDWSTGEGLRPSPPRRKRRGDHEKHSGGVQPRSTLDTRFTGAQMAYPDPVRQLVVPDRPPLKVHKPGARSQDEGDYISQRANSIMRHANLSTKSLDPNMVFGPNERMKQGPVAHNPVVQKQKQHISHAMPLQPRPRLPSNMSIRSVMEATVGPPSVRRHQRMESNGFARQRLVSNPHSVKAQVGVLGHYAEPASTQLAQMQHRRTESSSSRMSERRLR